MAHREAIPVEVRVDLKGFDEIADRLTTSLTTIDAIALELKRAGRIMQRRAVANVSGVVRAFEGKTFIINRVTGNLARSIQVTSANPLTVSVEASAKYASDVELGTRGPVDLKKTKLAGKIVPMPLSSVQGRAIAGSKGNLKHILVNRFNTKLTPTTGFKATPKFASTGRRMGTTYILFRRVPSRGGTGWIIPQKPPRPFLAESGAYTAPILKEAVEAAYKTFLEEGDT